MYTQYTTYYTQFAYNNIMHTKTTHTTFKKYTHTTTIHIELTQYIHKTHTDRYTNVYHSYLYH